MNLSGGGCGGCLQDGNPCSSGTGCCSRTCADFGSGTTICAAVGGCRLTGNPCLSTGQCCGGAPAQGGVTCDPGTSRCDNGTSCNGSGNICGAPVLPDGGKINASQNCCDGMKDVCKLDTSGVPRCFGGKTGQCPTGYTGTAPCCIAAGNACDFKDQCCNGAPCLPNTDGGPGLVCAPPQTCRVLGTLCNPAQQDGGLSERCCAGNSCLPASGGNFVCQPSTTDGGSMCLPNNSVCISSLQCCSGTCDGQEGMPFTCRPPRQCSAQSGPCTAAADCCSGLTCSFASGSSIGTCVNATCGGGGQPCSATNACCNGFVCRDSSGALCGSTGTCTCNSIID
jgi:hypothetical protein